MNREIPIIADTYVDREFGTGVVKITPAHDPNDFEVGKRHNLPEIDVMTNDGHMNAAAGKYAGLDRFAARARIVADLEALGLLESIEDITHAVGVCDRCKSDSRAAHFHAVVHEDEAARRACKASGARRADRSGSRKSAHDSAQLARKYSRLVHLAPALVGPSHSHLALRRIARKWFRRLDSRVEIVEGHARAAGVPTKCPKCGGAKLDAGYRRARHVVQLRPVAVFHARLAGRHAPICARSIPPACSSAATTFFFSGTRA